MFHCIKICLLRTITLRFIIRVVACRHLADSIYPWSWELSSFNTAPWPSCTEKKQRGKKTRPNLTAGPDANGSIDSAVGVRVAVSKFNARGKKSRNNYVPRFSFNTCNGHPKKQSS